MTYTQEETIDVLAVMRKQEEAGYKASDYLFQQEQGATVSSPQQLAEDGSVDPIDVECRFRMAEWCYQIVDFCKFKRETVAVSMSYLDRFLCTEQGRAVRKDRTQFQLAAMTTLYSAVKIHEPEAMEPKLIANLSRGAFTTLQVEQMEFTILNAIQWRVNPPTAVAFCQLLTSLIPVHILPPAARNAVMDLAKFQTELAVSDYDFVTINASSVAFASLMNSLESINMDATIIDELQFNLAQACRINTAEAGITDIQVHLYEAITKQPGSERLLSNLVPAASCARDSNYVKATATVANGSPRCVSQTGQ